MACLPATPWAVPPVELARRRDLRGYRICSIDPPTARDLDDALHCVARPDGNFEVGVRMDLPPDQRDGLQRWIRRADHLFDLIGGVRMTF